MGSKDSKPMPQHAGAMMLALLIVVTSGTALVSYFVTVAGFRELPEMQQMQLNSVGWVEIGLTFFVYMASFTGAMWLFLLRRAALHSFICAFAAGIVRFIWAAFSVGSFDWGWDKDLVVIGFLLAICVYVWWLDRSEALR